MLQPRKLILLLFIHAVIGSKEGYRDPDDARGELLTAKRTKRESPEITTVLLIDNDGNFGKPTRPSGLLTSTARTFISDGATTEYATQIIGTTLDGGRFYAQLLQTSSRVYYGDQKPRPVKNTIDHYVKPSEPVVIFPTKVIDNSLNLVKPEVSPEEILKSTGDSLFFGQNVQLLPGQVKDDERELLENVIRARKIDSFNKRNVDGIKPTKVSPQVHLPTFTVRHDFAPSGISVTAAEEKEEKKEEKLKQQRLGKNFFGKPTFTKLDTVTYVGFADFVTTVGNTVIVFQPSTKSVANSVAHTNEVPTVTTTVKTFMSLTPGMVTKTIPGHNLIMQTSIPTLVVDRSSKGIHDFEFKSSFLAKEQDMFENPTTIIEPSEMAVEPTESIVYSSTATVSATEPLPTYATTVTRSFGNGVAKRPLGLLKSIGGTKAYNDTTTHFTSLVYGTYIGNKYTEIIKTSSSSFYLHDKATIFLDPPTTEHIETTTQEDEDDEELLTTGDDIPPTQDPPTNPPEVPSSTLEQPTLAVSRVIPSTVYKTFTYLTTFFIPADETSTTTSIRSREVVTSDVIYETKIIDESWAKDSDYTMIEPTEVNLIESTDNPDPEFQLPKVRILAPIEQITTTTEEPTTITSPKDETDDTTPISTVTLPSSSSLSSSTSSTTTTTTSGTTQETTAAETETTVGDILITTENYLQPSTENIVTDGDEIEVIYKTLYTTYTYLTTFFQEDSTSVSSREVVETNIITSTITADPISATATTKLTESAKAESADLTTYTFFTTIFDEGTTSVITRTEVVSNIQPTPSVQALPSSLLANEDLLKSKFEMLLKEQQNIQTESPPTDTTTYSTTTETATAETIKPTGVLKRGKYGTIARKLKRPIKVTTESNDVITTSPATFSTPEKRKVIRKRIRTKSRLLPKSTTIIDEAAGVTTIPLEPAPSTSEPFITHTDVTRSRSVGRQVKRIAPPEPVDERSDSVLLDDQISSESNTDEIEPSASPTILLQTSFTTFTYFTTVYKGTSSDIISRLETVTNVATETVTPEALLAASLSPEDATLPITYFTTFTYWTTLYKDGNTVVTSREETVSNIVTPTIEPTSVIPTIQTTVAVQTSSVETTTHNKFVPGFIPSETPTEPPELVTESPISTKPIEDSTEPVGDKEELSDNIEPTTFYTTYTYFTTSYIGDETEIKSRLETVTNVVLSSTPTITEVDGNDLHTGRAINPASQNQVEDTSSSSLKTGLLSTLLSTSVNDGTTTLFSTDVFGTYIDGLYAKVLESTTKVVTDSKSTANDEMSTSAPVVQQKTGIVSINEGRIVDADGVSTTYFTTKAIGTSIEQLYAQVVESTSSIVVDNDKKSALASLSPSTDDIFKTGLVRLIEGSIIKDDTTTHYESRVIGTLIDGQYAQIIESTSSYRITPTSTVDGSVKATEAAKLTESASPATVQSSIDQNEDDDENNENDDGDDNDKRLKSRLSFQQKKKTFTPVIRPFASRARPTFLPKKKTVGSSSAQTVTRSNFTPTITATLAATKTDGLSRNRFSGRRSSSTVAEVKPTSSSKRFSGRGRTSSLAADSSSTTPSIRGRSSSRIASTPSLNLSSSSRRGSSRSSSSRPPTESIRPTVAAARPRIRPTGLPGRHPLTTSTTTTSTPPPEEDNLDVDDEDNQTNNEEVATTATTTTTTTEDPNLARRHSNPLLRFRKPIVPRVPSVTTRPEVSVTTPKRASASRNLQKSTTIAPTTSTTTRRSRPANSFNKVNITPNRARPGNNLFPPRGLFKKTETTEAPKEDEVEEVEYEEYDSNVEETAPSANRRTSLSTQSRRPNRRSKRQTEYGTRRASSNYNSRYTRKPTRPAQERYDYYDDYETITEAPKVTSRGGRNYARARITTAVPVTNPPRIRPTPASIQTSRGAPFTLREKDSNPRQTNFRRNQATTPRRRTTYKTTESPLTTRRSSRIRPSQVQLRGRGSYNTQRRTSSTRGRGRYGDIEETNTFLQPAFDGTITVTHKVPTEVTIPFITGKVTEYRNVITARPSIEVLGPHQYTITSTNGGTLLFLNSEITNALPNGATEVTKFLVHETPTTSITFTPTTIRGRKTSFSHIVPSTVYEVENLVTTLQPSLPSPLANILLSQLLLGNLNLQPQAVQQPMGTPTPTTELKTKTTTYVTSVTEHQSTIIPLTFRGKEILTTILDSSVNIITATEFITETIVTTPTVQSNPINSLLLPALLQAQLLNPVVTPTQTPNLVVDPLQFPEVTSKSTNTLRESEENLEEEKEDLIERGQAKLKKDVAAERAQEVVTLYVSGRRPGEFSTIVSTISGADSQVRKRETYIDDIERLIVEASEVKQVRVLASPAVSLEAFRDDDDEDSFNEVVLGSEEIAVPESKIETESLESVLGDITQRATQIYSTSSNPAMAYKSTKKHSYLSKSVTV